MSNVSNAWLGIATNFNEVADKEAFTEFEIKPQGWYKATVKNAVMGVIGENNKPALSVYFELEEDKTEITQNYFIPQAGDKDTAKEFKEQNLKNLLSRCVYSHLTKAEYSNLPNKDINTSSPNDLIGKKVLVKIVQEPFIAKDKDTGAIKFTDTPKGYVMATMPKQLVNLIKKQEEKARVIYDKVPSVLFSNKVAAYGLNFYNDYEEEEKKNSLAYDFIQSLAAEKNASTAASVDQPMAY